MSKMSELEQTVWDECGYRQAAPNDATRERWENDRFSAFIEHFRVRPLPTGYEELLAAAMTEWQQLEHSFLERLQVSRNEFDQQFPMIRDSFLICGEDIPPDIHQWGAYAGGVVQNLDVVNCFACFLPHAIPLQLGELAKTGRRIAAVFYLEQIGKVPIYGREYKADVLMKADGAWRYADHLAGKSKSNGNAAFSSNGQ